MAKKSEKSYSLTPKGIAWLALHEAGINVSVDEPAFHAFWDKFVELLARHGYSLPGIPVPTPFDTCQCNTCSGCSPLPY